MLLVSPPGLASADAGTVVTVRPPMVSAAAAAEVARTRKAERWTGTEGPPGKDGVRASIGKGIRRRGFLTEFAAVFSAGGKGSVEAEGEGRLEVVLGVGPEGDVGLG